MTLAESAAFLAQQWPVFPCDANKRPVTPHGYKDAVCDPQEARELFRRPGAAMIGVPAGAWSGLLIVDLDVKNGGRGLEWLAANEHRLPRTRRHRTASGGVHLLFRHPTGRSIKNSASRIAPNVDIRTDGGYVIFPPSAGYTILDDAMPADAPEWLLEILTPAAPEPVKFVPSYRPSGDATPYGTAALDRATTAILNAPDGAKHDTLNREAYSIGGLVTAGEIPEAEARSALESALAGIRHRCEDFPAAQKTLAGAFRDGMAAPRSVPPPRLLRRTVEEFAPPTWEEPPPRDAPPEHWTAEPEVAPEPVVADAPPKAPLPVVRFHEAQAAIEAQDFVEGLLTRAGMSVIYGESNSGKTFFALDLALHVAAGRPWRGREVEQGFVLYLALEGSHAILNRVAAFKAEHGLEDAVLPFAIVPVALNLLDPEADAGRVVDTCRAVATEFEAQPILIVVDTLARAIAGGNENAPEDMGSLIRTGDELRQSAPAHVMWIHHSGKDTAKGARGHSSLRAATDTEIEVVATGPARCATVTKQRDMECEGAFPYQLRVVEVGVNRRGKPVTSCVVDHDTPPISASPGAYRPRLEGHRKQAYEILQDLIAASGESGFDGVPASVPSVPDRWWRETFYQRAMAGQDQDAKQKAFKRASDYLTTERLVCGNRGRVWIAR